MLKRMMVLVAMFGMGVMHAVGSCTNPGNSQWSQRFGTSNGEYGRALATDTSDNIIVAGTFQGAINLGGGSLTSAGAQDIFLAKYAASGTHLWSQHLGGTSDDLPYAVATDSAGNIVVAGGFSGTTNLGGSNLVSAGSTDIFVAKYTAAGAHVWSKRFGSTFDDTGYGVGFDGAGNVVLTGYFRGTVNFGGSNLVSESFGFGVMIVKLAGADGAHMWSKQFACTSDVVSYGVAVESGGDLVVVGYYQGQVDLGGGFLTSAGSADAFIAKLHGTDGSYVWGRSVGAASSDRALGAAVDASGNVAVTGFFNGTVNFGTGAITSQVNDSFIAVYDTNNTPKWSKKLGGTLSDEGDDVAFDASGHVVATGYFLNSADFGGGTLTSAGGQDIYVAKYTTASGAHVWSRRFGGTSGETGYSISTNAVGVVVTGYFQNTIDFDNGPLTSAGITDIYLVSLRP